MLRQSWEKRHGIFAKNLLIWAKQERRPPTLGTKWLVNFSFNWLAPCERPSFKEFQTFLFVLFVDIKEWRLSYQCFQVHLNSGWKLNSSMILFGLWNKKEPEDQTWGTLSYSAGARVINGLVCRRQLMGYVVPCSNSHNIFAFTINLPAQMEEISKLTK